VQINEWLASNTSPGGYPNPVGGAYDDWFELYNPASTAVDLAGYFLTDDLSDPYHYLIPSGCVIPPGGYLLVWADGDPTRNSATNSDLHVNFQLSKSGESIGLFAPNGVQIDSVQFGSQTNNVSQGRWPDGEPGIEFMTTPTPRAANLLHGMTNAPAFTSLVRQAGGELAMTWRSIPGKSYQVEYKDRLEEQAWAILIGDLVAQGTRTTVLLPAQAAAQRFYRIRQL
jgi:hypothetical protein